MRILLADDEPSNLLAFKDILENIGHEVTDVCSAEEALEEFRKGRYDLVLTDNRMGEMSGIELAQQVKRINPRMPVVLLTGTIPDKKPAGVDRVISKPARTDDFRRLIELLQPF